ncbi:hypothetical protein QWJ07_03990 [Frankia sp. RB7]|nr:hypothetical protein [Frankia sp. RB7]
MKIKIKERAYNVTHGKSVMHFEVGETRDVHEDVAESLVNAGKAEPVAKAARKIHSEDQGKGK